MLKCETYSSREAGQPRKQHRARIVNVENGNVQWQTSEGYNNRGDLNAAINALRHGAEGMVVVDIDAEPSK